MGLGGMKTSKKTRHDHRGSMWAIAGGHIWWCYQCGAIRRAHLVEPPNTWAPLDKKWTRPTGLGGENPEMMNLRKWARSHALP